MVFHENLVISVCTVTVNTQLPGIQESRILTQLTNIQIIFAIFFVKLFTNKLAMCICSSVTW
jgi:hypothetical protein